jgi:hypothetical protein
VQLLNVITARSIWLLNIDELNPQGKSVQSEFLEWLRDSYHFTKFPASMDDLGDNKGLIFQNGEFQVREEFFISVDLTIFLDGLVADSRSSTRDTDRFIEDALQQAVREFGFTYSAHTIRQKSYLSELNVRCDKKLESLHYGLTTLANRISQLIPEPKNLPFQASSIGVWPVFEASKNVSPPFQFERRVNTPFSENRYYSRAPLHTDDHLLVLNEFDSMLVG